MNIDLVNNKASINDLVSLKKETPVTNLQPSSPNNTFGDDGVLAANLKKINNSGSNPFGSPPNTSSDKSLKEGVVKKAYQSFAELDSNRNGFLSNKELINKMHDPNVKSEKAAVVATLLTNETKIRNLSNDEKTIESSGISKNDLIALDKIEGQGSLKEKVESNYYNALYKASSAKSYFDSDGKLILPKKASEISFSHINQGGAGDCYFLAALASQAQRNPQKILDMIKDNKDGTYDIKFSDKTVKVKAPTETEIGLYGDGAGWMSLIEKAYAVYRNDGALLKKDNPYDKSGGGSVVIGRGIKELTGNSFETNLLKATNKNSTRSKLIDAEKNNKLMTASISKHIVSKSEFNLPDGHVYTIMGYDSQTDKVKIRNPWGHTEAENDLGIARDGSDDGVFEVSIDEFYKAFSMVAYEKK
ncbi:hypothetical protein EON78_03575 [bacterium]|nr:MAG: hypothetical protein EON78_03575 [bacterium]